MADAVNELSCELAANVIAEMRKDKDIKPPNAAQTVAEFADDEST